MIFLSRFSARYELVESWSQTLDFSKKKKGTQCDAVETEHADTQVAISQDNPGQKCMM